MNSVRYHISRCTIVILVIKIVIFLPQLSQGVCLLNSWNEYVKTFSKIYKNSIDEDRSRSVWLKNIELIKEYNEKADNGSSTFWLAENKFADSVSQYCLFSVFTMKKLLF